MNTIQSFVITDPLVQWKSNKAIFRIHSPLCMIRQRGLEILEEGATPLRRFFQWSHFYPLIPNIPHTHARYSCFI
jgi:hypothetical protein